jgi:hypothetical protein
MKYEVIRPFMDAQDNNRAYEIGDTFPAKGVKVTKARIKALLSGNTVTGKVYLKEIAEPEE